MALTHRLSPWSHAAAVAVKLGSQTLTGCMVVALDPGAPLGALLNARSSWAEWLCPLLHGGQRKRVEEM